MRIYYVSYFLTEASFVLHPHDSHRDIRSNLSVIPDISTFTIDTFGTNETF